MIHRRTLFTNIVHFSSTTSLRSHYGNFLLGGELSAAVRYFSEIGSDNRHLQQHPTTPKGSPLFADPMFFSPIARVTSGSSPRSMERARRKEELLSRINVVPVRMLKMRPNITKEAANVADRSERPPNELNTSNDLDEDGEEDGGFSGIDNEAEDRRRQEMFLSENLRLGKLFRIEETGEVINPQTGFRVMMPYEVRDKYLVLKEKETGAKNKTKEGSIRSKKRPLRATEAEEATTAEDHSPEKVDANFHHSQTRDNNTRKHQSVICTLCNPAKTLHRGVKHIFGIGSVANLQLRLHFLHHHNIEVLVSDKEVRTGFNIQVGVKKDRY